VFCVHYPSQVVTGAAYRPIHRHVGKACHTVLNRAAGTNTIHGNVGPGPAAIREQEALTGQGPEPLSLTTRVLTHKWDSSFLLAG